MTVKPEIEAAGEDSYPNKIVADALRAVAGLIQEHSEHPESKTSDSYCRGLLRARQIVLTEMTRIYQFYPRKFS
jgi:hypothetical protein